MSNVINLERAQVVASLQKLNGMIQRAKTPDVQDELLQMERLYLDLASINLEVVERIYRLRKDDGANSGKLASILIIQSELQLLREDKNYGPNNAS